MFSLLWGKYPFFLRTWVAGPGCQERNTRPTTCNLFVLFLVCPSPPKTHQPSSADVNSSYSPHLSPLMGCNTNQERLSVRSKVLAGRVGQVSTQVLARSIGEIHVKKITRQLTVGQFSYKILHQITFWHLTAIPTSSDSGFWQSQAEVQDVLCMF